MNVTIHNPRSGSGSPGSFNADFPGYGRQATKKIITLQAAVRGYLARKKLGELEFEKFGKRFEGEAKQLIKRVKKVADLLESRWRLTKISQTTEIQAMEKLQGVLIDVRMLSSKRKQSDLNLASPKELEDHFFEKESKLQKAEDDFLRVCGEVGFGSVKQGLKAICGPWLKGCFSEEALDHLEEYNMLLQPTSHVIFEESGMEQDGKITFLSTTGGMIEVDKASLDTGLPILAEQTAFNSESEIDRWKSAELLVPYAHGSSKRRMIVFRGVIKNDPLNAAHDFSVVRQKKSQIQRAFFKEQEIPREFRFNYLSNYPLRDLLLKEPPEVVEELKKDHLYFKKIQTEGIKPTTIQEFLRASIREQLRMFWVLLLDENPKNALFLYEMTGKDLPEYRNLLRETLHFNQQKKLNLGFVELDAMKKKLEGQSEGKISYETRIALSAMDEGAKCKALEKLKEAKSKSHDAEKAERYLETLLGIPFGVYTKEPVTAASERDEISSYLAKVEADLEASVHGAQEAKEAVLEWIAQRVSNSESKGECIALEGPPGVGKTTFAREGISKALGRPFAFISMGGQSDSCFLIGHNFTYVGSTWGRIVEILRESKCMDPVIYIDEVDKISQTDKGRELIGVLTGLTDFSQNKEFQDKYFSGIKFDLSRALFIFSYNDPALLDPVFKDRLKIIKLGAHSLSEKQVIARKHLMAEILNSCGFKDGEIIVTDLALKFLIESYTFEAGVRKLKENLFAIVRKLNLLRLKDPSSVPLPYVIDEEVVVRFRKEPKVEFKKIISKPQIGTVNGLYATTAGIGGLTIVQAFKTLADERLKLTLTGSQGNVMQESMAVARSVAWNLISHEVREGIYKMPPEGLHIHCPEGATPKDGPSAGGAITTAMISQLMGIPVKNDVAMTGEIDLTGRITKIGGLSAKLQGAKRAGVRLALIPRDNQKDLEKIVEKFPDLIDGAFQVKIVDTIYDILDEALVKNPIKRPESWDLLIQKPPSTDSIISS